MSRHDDPPCDLGKSRSPEFQKLVRKARLPCLISDRRRLVRPSAPYTYRSSVADEAALPKPYGPQRLRNDSVPSCRPTRNSGFQASQKAGVRPVTARARGRSRATESSFELPMLDAEQERVSNQSESCQAMGHGSVVRSEAHSLCWVARSSDGSAPVVPVRRQAHPLSSSNRDESVQVEGCVSLEHVVHGASELGGEHAQSLSLRVLPGQPGAVLLPRRILAQKQSTAASEKAHFKWTLPIFLPPAAFFLPADSRLPLTKRE